MLLTGAAKKHREEYMDLMLSSFSKSNLAFTLTLAGLPFQTETNTGFGILFKTYLDVTVFSYEGDAITESTTDSQSAKDAKSQALDFVEQSFESVKNPRLEVERGFRFWDTVSLSLAYLKRGADRWIDYDGHQAHRRGPSCRTRFAPACHAAERHCRVQAGRPVAAADEAVSGVAWAGGVHMLCYAYGLDRRMQCTLSH